MRLKDAKQNPKNPRKISEQKLAMLQSSMDYFGDLSGIVHNKRTGNLVGGNQRHKTLPDDAQITIEKRYRKPTRTGTVAVGYIEIDGERFSFRQVDWDEKKEMAAVIAANKHGGEWDMPMLTTQLIELDDGDFNTELTGFDDEEMERLCTYVAGMPLDESDSKPGDATKDAGTTTEKKTPQTLADRFMIPPFSVLNAREGWWQDRKRFWIDMGIKSHLGRGATCLLQSEQTINKDFYREREREREREQRATKAKTN